MTAKEIEKWLNANWNFVSFEERETEENGTYIEKKYEKFGNTCYISGYNTYTEISFHASSHSWTYGKIEDVEIGVYNTLRFTGTTSIH